MKVLNDMLKERNKWSQGRVYLLWSVIAYYITLAVLLISGLHKKSDLDMSKFHVIIDALEYAMVLFGGYVFGGKAIDMIKVIGTKRTSQK